MMSDSIQTIILQAESKLNQLKKQSSQIKRELQVQINAQNNLPNHSNSYQHFPSFSDFVVSNSNTIGNKLVQKACRTLATLINNVLVRQSFKQLRDRQQRIKNIKQTVIQPDFIITKQIKLTDKKKIKFLNLCATFIQKTFRGFLQKKLFRLASNRLNRLVDLVESKILFIKTKLVLSNPGMIALAADIRKLIKVVKNSDAATRRHIEQMLKERRVFFCQQIEQMMNDSKVGVYLIRSQFQKFKQSNSRKNNIIKKPGFQKEIQNLQSNQQQSDLHLHQQKFSSNFPGQRDQRSIKSSSIHTTQPNKPGQIFHSQSQRPIKPMKTNILQFQQNAQKQVEKTFQKKPTKKKKETKGPSQARNQASVNIQSPFQSKGQIKVQLQQKAMDQKEKVQPKDRVVGKIKQIKEKEQQQKSQVQQKPDQGNNSQNPNRTSFFQKNWDLNDPRVQQLNKRVKYDPKKAVQQDRKKKKLNLIASQINTQPAVQSIVRQQIVNKQYRQIKIISTKRNKSPSISPVRRVSINVSPINAPKYKPEKQSEMRKHIDLIQLQRTYSQNYMKTLNQKRKLYEQIRSRQSKLKSSIPWLKDSSKFMKEIQGSDFQKQLQIFQRKYNRMLEV